MELKTGYKQTEVGVIPNDWEVKELGEVAFLKRGKFTPRPRNNPIFYGGDIPFVQTGDVTNSNGKIMEYTQTLNEGGLAVSALFKKGTILMTIAANIGYTGILQIDMACPDSLVAIDGLEKIDNVFLNYYFSFKRQELDNLSTSGTQKNLNIELLKPFKILLPPTFAEQTAIATTLSDTDQYITHLEKLIAKKRNIKQGAMQELLRAKEGWVVKKLTDVVDYIHGKAHERDIVEDGKYIVVNSKFISTDGEVIKSSNVNNCPARRNDILTVLSDLPNGKALAKCYYVVEDNIFAVNQRICIWRTKGAKPKFLFYLLNRNQYFLALDDGLSQTHILNHHIEKCQIAIPKSLDEQTRIATILSDMDSEITTLETKLSKAQSIKQGMMQQLLTGKIRLI